MKPTAGDTATAPHSGDPPTRIGAREWSRPRWPGCWHRSGTYALSQFAATAPPSLRPGPRHRTTGHSWSRGGTAKPKSPGATGGVSPATAPSFASSKATGLEPCPRTCGLWTGRYWPRSPKSMQCGTWCCPPQGSPSCSCSTSTCARTRGRHRVGVARPPRARVGVAATLRGAGRLSHTLTQVRGPPAGGRVESAHHPPPPSPEGTVERSREPPPPAGETRPPLPLPARGTAVCPPPPPGPRRRTGVHHTHGRPICRVVGKPSCAPRRPVSLKISPQIKSNQIKSG